MTCDNPLLITYAYLKRSSGQETYCHTGNGWFIAVQTSKRTCWEFVKVGSKGWLMMSFALRESNSIHSPTDNAGLMFSMDLQNAHAAAGGQIDEEATKYIEQQLSAKQQSPIKQFERRTSLLPGANYNPRPPPSEVAPEPVLGNGNGQTQQQPPAQNAPVSLWAPSGVFKLGREMRPARRYQDLKFQ